MNRDAGAELREAVVEESKRRAPEGPRPLFTIITVVRDAKGQVEDCIESVGRQTCRDYEYLVIDGGSSDGTLEVLRARQAQITSWMSEPDTGVYDAMNKGMSMATGSWLYFLGADDRLSGPDILERVRIHVDPKWALVFGNVRYASGELFRSRFSNSMLLHNTLHHQSVFYNRAFLLDRRYDVSLRVASDYALNLALFRSNAPAKYLDETIAVCMDKGLSRTLLRTAFVETNRVRARYLTSFWRLPLTALFAVKFLAWLLLRNAPGRLRSRFRSP
jgi:putative colanic acid biosynthesis glycosyltransferase